MTIEDRLKDIRIEVGGVKRSLDDDEKDLIRKVLAGLPSRDEGPPPVRVAAATVVFDEAGRILVIERASDAATGGGELAIPGGKVDPLEALADAARRELFEEVGVEAHSMTRLSVVSEDCFWGPAHHYVTHYYVVTSWSGSPEIREPSKHTRVDWIDPTELRHAVESMPDSSLRVFGPLANLVMNGGIDMAQKEWRRSRRIAS